MQYIGTSTQSTEPSVELGSLSYDQRLFREARYELVSHLNELGHYGCIVYADSYKGNGLFSKHLYPIDAQHLVYEVRGTIRLDALYDKTKLYPSDLAHITDVDVGRICNDKYQTNKLLGALQPKSLLLSSAKDIARLSELDNGSGMAVVKSLVGSGGKEVIVDMISRLQQTTFLLPFPLIAQEFIETSRGVPGLVAGRHDVRAIVINGKVTGGSVRTPEEGGYLSNTGRGGTLRSLETSELPDRLLQIVRSIDDALPNKPRFYAADFMYDKTQDKWFLVELNGSPGFLPTRFGSVGARCQEELTSALIDLASR